MSSTIGCMKMYRVFPLDGNDHVAGAPWILECEDDREATSFAEELVHPYPSIEIWDGARRVCTMIFDNASGASD
jgi:hypothetical protein